MKNLFGMSRGELENEIVGWGAPRFRGRQIYRWLYARGTTSFEPMTDLSRELRERLSRDYTITRPRIVSRNLSEDGTLKLSIELTDGRAVETVYIPDGERHTFCLSTQVGCPLKCTFCFSGTVRFERNLTPGEIVAQYLLAREELASVPARSNIVFMGMGEPLLNPEGVGGSLDILTDETACAVSPRRVTVSTAGIVEELERFATIRPAIGLAISLHATTNGDRDRIMPINRRHPLEELIAAARRLPLPRRRRITFEYVLLGGENDRRVDAERLASLLRGMKAKVNLIAYNPWPGSPHIRATREATERFVGILAEAGITVSLRRSRGDDVLAACGQLAGRSGAWERRGEAGARSG
jgi:23S rRNA (adenine2503-C2)-methyltransferase